MTLQPGESLRLIDGRWFIATTKRVQVCELSWRQRCSIQADTQAQSNDDDKKREEHANRLDERRLQDALRQRILSERNK